MHRNIEIFGYGSGLGAANSGTAEGPKKLAQSPSLLALGNQGLKMHWHQIFSPPNLNSSDKLPKITAVCEDLAAAVSDCLQQQKFFMVFGGDHTCGIGTWSGASEEDIGLIWIDAHMDSHTIETSPSGNIHGMPVACLLGKGAKSLVNLFKAKSKIKPENLCFIGVRSYETGEAQFLQEKKVRIFYMDEVKQRGMKAVLKEAIEYVSKSTQKFGVSLDVDSIDPLDAPGTGVPEPDGIRADDMCDALTLLADEKRLIGVEIVEFNPELDQDGLTEKLITRMVAAITLG